MPSKRATVPVLCLRMRPSNCALCRFFRFRRHKRDVRREKTHEDYWFDDVISEYSPEECKFLLTIIGGQLVHPRCLKYVKQAEDLCDMSIDNPDYIECPILELDYDPDK